MPDCLGVFKNDSQEPGGEGVGGGASYAYKVPRNYLREIREIQKGASSSKEVAPRRIQNNSRENREAPSGASLGVNC